MVTFTKREDIGPRTCHNGGEGSSWAGAKARAAKEGVVERLSAWAERRAAPLMVTVAVLVGVMAYSVLFHPLLHVGQIALLAPSDLWSLAQSSYAILHGNFAHIYVNHGSLTSPPAFETALAP